MLPFENGEYTTRLTHALGTPVSTPQDLSQRLVRIAHILNAAGVPRVGSTMDAIELHLRSVPLERMKQLTGELAQRDGRDADELDLVTMRLLLEEYTAAVGHLRAVARAAAARVDGAPVPLKQTRKYIHRHLKLLDRRARQRAEREERARLSDARRQRPTAGSD